MTLKFLMLAVLLAAAPAVQAQDCTPEAIAAARGAVWETWARPAPLAAGQDATGAPAVKAGSAVRLTLVPMASIRLAAKPGKAATDAKAPGFGGIVAFTAPTAGRYRIALQTPAWVDVVSNGRSVPSQRHGHGEACSGIRKIVDFDLPAGNHHIQISNDDKSETTLMVAATAR